MSDSRKKKKVLYMITKGNFGGAQRYVFDLAVSIPKEKFEVVVACGEGETLKEKLKENNIRVIEIPSLQRNISFTKDIFALMETIKIIKDERPDILHLNSSKMGGIGALAGRILKVPKIIFTGHGWAFNEERGVLSKSAIAVAHWMTIVLCHKTIAVSKRVADQISRFPLVKNKIIQIYNGIGEIKFLEKEEARRQIAPEIKESFWIGTISELHKNKGLDFLIEAFAGVYKNRSNIACVIIGGGEEKENLQKIAKKFGIENKVYFLGFIKNASRFLKAFDIFTLTSRTEAFPYAPLEAGLAGLPVVASWVGGIPEIITNEESGRLARVGNVEEIWEDLSEMIANQEEAKTLGKNLKEKIESDFSLEKMIEKTINLY